MKRQEKKIANASAKSKEVQPNPQAAKVAPHLLLPHLTKTFTTNITFS